MADADDLRARPRPSPLLRIALAAACFAIAVLLDPLLRSDPVRAILIQDRVEESVAHGDGEREFARSILEREAGVVLANARLGLITLGSAILSILLLEAVRKERASRPTRAATLVFAAFLAATATFAGQVRRAVDGFADGLFTESEEARMRRAFDVALEPSLFVAASTPSDARIVVIDFPAPHVLQKFGYLVHPRKVFVPPRTEFRFSADEVRRILREMPHGIDWCFDAGYTHIVDLTTLLATGDPAAIIDLATLPR